MTRFTDKGSKYLTVRFKNKIDSRIIELNASIKYCTIKYIQNNKNLNGDYAPSKPCKCDLTLDQWGLNKKMIAFRESERESALSLVWLTFRCKPVEVAPLRSINICVMNNFKYNEHQRSIGKTPPNSLGSITECRNTKAFNT